MRTFKLTLAYDGTNFSGWQSQVDRRTVQVVLQHTELPLRLPVFEQLTLPASA